MRKNRPPTLLLTGGIASGKTFVSDYLQSKGATVIDTDLISKMMTRADNSEGIAALKDIRARFGDGLFTNGDTLDRQKMRELIFNDAEAKRDLEAILHGRILNTVKKHLADLQEGEYGVVVVPVIYEGSPYLDLCDEVLVIEVPYQLQLQRLMARDSIDQTLAEKIISSQISRLDRRKLGDYIIVGENRAFVERQLDQLHARYAHQSLSESGFSINEG